MARWQAYLGQLAAAGIEPPPAADLADSADLPAGLSPALDAAGRPVPGIAWAVIGSSPVTVLPAETVAAVSTALSQLGKPFVAGTVRPRHLRLRWLHLRGLAARRLRRPVDAGGASGPTGAPVAADRPADR